MTGAEGGHEWRITGRFVWSGRVGRSGNEREGLREHLPSIVRRGAKEPTQKWRSAAACAQRFSSL